MDVPKGYMCGEESRDVIIDKTNIIEVLPKSWLHKKDFGGRCMTSILPWRISDCKMTFLHYIEHRPLGAAVCFPQTFELLLE